MSRVPRRRRTAAGLITLAVALLVATTGCASIPSSSRPQVIAQSMPASAGADDDDLRYDEIVPRAGEAPEDIVRDFLRASGSFERSHARARAYLTNAANAAWKDVPGATILEDAPYLNPGKGGTSVTMTSQQRGRLNEDGSYVPGKAPYPYAFRLKKVNGNWRIDNPPNGLLIEAGTFEAAYRSYEIYFLDSSTRTRVVPDVRWYAGAPESVPTQLVTALEQGPSQLLGDSVLSDLAGISLQNNIEPGGDRVKVFLTGLDDQAETLSPGGFAQLVWTLHQVGVGGIEVYSDGRLLAPKKTPGQTLQQFGDWRSFDPDGLTATATSYFIQGGTVRTTQNAPVPGAAGRSGFRARSVAVSQDQRSLAVVRDIPGGRALYVGPPGSLRATVTGSELTRPTWGLGTREVWTVQNGRNVLIVPLNGEAVRVDVQKLDDLGHIRALNLSRDGTRVAVVAGAAGQEKLWVGVVSQEGGSTRVGELRVLEVGDSPVSDISWSDALHVVALTRSGAESGLYSVDVSGVSAGQLVGTAGLPGPPAAIAAGPSLPLLTIAEGGLWRAVSTDDSWTIVTDDRARAGASAPVYPG